MKSLLVFVTIVSFSLSAYGQKLPVVWDELTSSDFVEAIKKSEGVCLIPLGVIEKHGQHLPLGTDVFQAQAICRRAAEKEYCIVFPALFTGQIFEAKQQPGTIAYSSELMLRFLDETCKEISRNGIKKIMLINSHGGSNALLQYFCQIQLESPRDYAVYYSNTAVSQDVQRRINEMRKSDTGGHADEVESSCMLAIRPDLVQMERATTESGSSKNRLNMPLYTGIWWYSLFPNHYAGDAKDANVALGEISVEGSVAELIRWIKAVKADNNTIQLQNEFFKESLSPLDTKAK